MEKGDELSKWGFFSSDGHFQPMSSLNVTGLEYISKSMKELEVMLTESIIYEQYEKSALIRDEIIKRKKQTASKNEPNC